MTDAAKPTPARYRLYVDESGDHTFNLMEDPAHRYLALLGVWFRQADEYVAFADDLERFKRFTVSPVLHTIAWDNDADFAPEYLRDKIVEQANNSGTQFLAQRA